MKFVDSCDVDVVAGKGGNGAIAFRREKFVPFGGPSGGDGGRGGDVVFAADEGLSTLLDLTYGRTLRAQHGEHGLGKDMYGRGAPDLVVRVPVGTQVKNRETGEIIFDLDRPDSRVVVAKGGKGGRGNIHFATPHDRAPRRAEPGEEGQERKYRLELKVMADVGLLGFPNVGKSTFIRAVSRARPKVADYPFTTLTPHLGVVRIGEEASMVIADIPGLIPGASEGAGLGHRFLKHVERTRALLHLVALDFGEERDPVADYDALMTELERFDPELARRPQIVALTKADLPEVREAFASIKARFAKKKIPIHLVSAATGEGVRELSIALYKLVTGSAVDDWELSPADGATTSSHADDWEASTQSGAWEIAAPPATDGAVATRTRTSKGGSSPRASKKPSARASTAAPAERRKTTKGTTKKKATKKKASTKGTTRRTVAKKTGTSKKPVATKKPTTKKATKKKPTTKKATKKKPTTKKATKKKR